MPREDIEARPPSNAADNVGYRPNEPDDWVDPDPLDVADALDDLASRSTDAEGHELHVTLLATDTPTVTQAIDMAGSDYSKGNQGPDWLKVGNYSAWAYDVGDDSVLTFEVPHDWVPGTDITIKVDWGCDEAFATNSGAVQWNVSWTATNHDGAEVLDAGSTTLDPGDQNIPATAKALTRTTMGIIAGASLAEEDEIGLMVERVATDGGKDPTADPFITHFYITYTAYELGKIT